MMIFVTEDFLSIKWYLRRRFFFERLQSYDPVRRNYTIVNLKYWYKGSLNQASTD